MIQLGGFVGAKEMARLPFGRHSGQHFNYNADLQKRWETAADSRVALDAIGSLSMSPDNLGDVQAWLGDLTAEERLFRLRYDELYRRVAALTTSVPVTLNTDVDVYETLLDTRILQRHVTAPKRVLDIGPGSGRHLANLMLRPWGAGSAYVAVESVGLPYMLQHLLGSALALQDPSCQFRDQLDHERARLPFPIDEELSPRTMWQVPLWRADLLPSQAFDVILCNYVLDELSSPDFGRVVDLLGRCLAPGGVIYCRGAQQRSMIKALYLFGFGTFHQGDITATIAQRGLRAVSCELIASTMTRVFMRADDAAARGITGSYTEIAGDVALVERLQQDFVAAAVAQMQRAATPVVIWVDPGPGHEALAQLLQRHLAALNVVGITNEHIVNEGPGPFGLRQVPLTKVGALGARAAFMVGYRTTLATRELRDALRPASLGAVRQFTWPFAYAPIERPAPRS
jgi:SAM-dependent methyltransferase